MSVRRITVAEARTLLEHEGYAYLDVRTEAEYAAGHPSGAYNVPVSFAGAQGMVPNARFADEVLALFPRDAKLVLGCRSGQRSLRAAAELAARGFDALVELGAGYSGARDAFGRVTEPGWEALGAPSESVTSGRSYAELARRDAGRAPNG